MLGCWHFILNWSNCNSVCCYIKLPAHLRRAILPVWPHCYQYLQTYGLHRIRPTRIIPLFQFSIFNF